MKKPYAPCKDCELRKSSCHSTCDMYTTFRKELDEYNAHVAKIKEDSLYYTHRKKQYFDTEYYERS